MKRKVKRTRKNYMNLKEKSQSGKKGCLESVKNGTGKSRLRKRKHKKDVTDKTPKKTKTRSPKQYRETSDTLEIAPSKISSSSVKEKNVSEPSIRLTNDEISIRENFKNTKFIILDDLNEQKIYKRPSSRAKKVDTPNKKVVKNKLKHLKPRSLYTLNKISQEENDFKKGKKEVKKTKREVDSDSGSAAKMNLKKNKRTESKEKSLKDETGKEVEQDANTDNKIENFWATPSLNLSKTSFNGYLPNANEIMSKAPQDEKSIIDKNFIKSLLEIAKCNRKIDSVNKQSQRCNESIVDKNSSSNQKKEEKRISKSKKNRKSKKRLHQTEKEFFPVQFDKKISQRISQEWTTRESDFQSVNNHKSKESVVQRKDGTGRKLGKIKSEKLKGQTDLNVSDKGIKVRNKNLKEKENSFIEIPYNDEDSKVTELWRNDTRVSSEHSISSKDSCVSETNDSSDGHEYLGIKSYRTLQKIVEDEVQRIYRGQKGKEQKKEIEPIDNIQKNEVQNPDLNENNKVNEKEIELTPETKKKRLTLSESKKIEKKLCKKLTIPTSQNYYERFNTKVKSELNLAPKNLLRTEAEKNSILQKINKEKKDELENKCFIEKKKSNEKRPSEIIKNWSVLRRLEKAFLALGTPNFSDKSFKNNKESNRKDQAEEKSFNMKIKSNNSNYGAHQINNQNSPLNLSKLKNSNNNTEFQKGNPGNENAQKVDSKLKMSGDNFRQSNSLFEPDSRPKCRIQMSPEKIQNENNEVIQQKTMINKKPQEGELFTCIKRNALSESKSGLIDDKEKPNPNNLENSNYDQKKAETKPSTKLRGEDLETKFIKKATTQSSVKQISKFPKGDFNKEFWQKLNFDKVFSENFRKVSDESAQNLNKKVAFNVIPQKNFSKDKFKSCTKIVSDPEAQTLAYPFLEYSVDLEDTKKNKSEQTIQINDLKKSVQTKNLKIVQTRKSNYSTESVIKENEYKGFETPTEIKQKNSFEKYNKERKRSKAKVSDKIQYFWFNDTEKEQSTPNSENSESEKLSFFQNLNKIESKTVTSASICSIPVRRSTKLVQDFIRSPSHRSENASSISTNSYGFFNSNYKNAGESVYESEPICNASLTSQFSTSTFNVAPIKRNVSFRKTNGKFQWESNVDHYREIVKDIINQYQRTNDFLKQSQNLRRLPNECSRQNAVDINLKDKKQINLVNQITNIGEYRKKVRSEFNALPPIEYKSKNLKSTDGQPIQFDFMNEGNLFVDRTAGEETDSDVKDHHPNVHKILDAQVYVDVKNLGRRQKTFGKLMGKVMSLQETAHSQGDAPGQSVKDKHFPKLLCEFKPFFSKHRLHENRLDGISNDKL